VKEEELTPEEAKELMYCWIHESQNRYGKVNLDAPLYLKLKRIAEPVLLKLGTQPISENTKAGEKDDNKQRII